MNVAGALIGGLLGFAIVFFGLFIFVRCVLVPGVEAIFEHGRNRHKKK